MGSNDSTVSEAGRRIDALIAAGDLDAAEQALDLSGGVIEPYRVHLLRGQVAWSRGNLSGALHEFDQAAGLAPDDVDVVAHRADALFAIGRRRRAKLLLWRAARKHNDPKLWGAAGQLDYFSGKPKRAAKKFARAVALAPDDLDALGRRIVTLKELRQFDQARQELSEGLARRPGDTELLLMLGVVELDDQQLEAAAAVFAQAQDHASERLDVVRLHALAMRRLGKFSAAQQLIEPAIGDPPSPEATELIVELALIRYFRGFPKEAERLSRQALALEPGNETAASNVAWILERQDRLEDAESCLKEALEHSPSSRLLLLELARIAEERHHFSTAAGYYKQALQIRRDEQARKGWRRVAWRTGRIPMLAPFLRSIDRETRRRFDLVRAPITQLDEVLADPHPSRRSLRTRVIRLAWRRARISAVVVTAFPIAIFPVWVAVGGMFSLNPVIFGGVGDSGADESTGGFATGFATGFLYVTELAACWAIIRRSVFRAGASFGPRLAACVGISVVATGLLTRARGDAPDVLVLPLLWSGAVVTVGSALWLAIYLLFAGAEQVAWHRARRDDPYAAAVTALLFVLHHLRTGVDPVDRTDVQPIVSSLEEAADGLENHLRNLKPTGDIRSDAWLTQRASGIATAVRDLKSWVLSPGAETFEALAARIELDLRSIANGYWRKLPWADPTAAAATSRRLRLIVTARNLLIASLPLVSVFIARSTGIVENSTADQLLLTSVAWAVVTLLVTLDPNFADKLAAFRDARSAVKGGGGSRGG